MVPADFAVPSLGGSVGTKSRPSNQQFKTQGSSETHGFALAGLAVFELGGEALAGNDHSSVGIRHRPGGDRRSRASSFRLFRAPFSSSSGCSWPLPLTASPASASGRWCLIAVLGAASYLVDFIAAGLGAKRVGASTRAVVGAALGTLLGLPLGLPGVIFGPLAGAILGELSAHRDFKRAGQVGLAAWIGFLVGTAVKIALAFSMIAIFLFALFVV